MPAKPIVRRKRSARRVRTPLLVALLLALPLAFSEASPVDQVPPLLSGVVVDETGTPIAEATVTVTSDAEGRPSIEVTSAPDGRFLLVEVPNGPFHLVVAAPGFAEQTVTGAITGDRLDVGAIRLRLAVNSVSVDVTQTIVEVAEQQIKEAEQQRVLGFVPNFFVSYNPDAAPLNTRQKFQLSWKAHLDPVQFGVVALVAAVQQHRNDYSAFGDGASGYGKRYAAAYATGMTRSLITQVVFPSVFRQDPRYFFKGTGTAGSRLGYALSRSVVRRGDNGRPQPNYSGILGSLAAGAISNFYYPAEDRRGARLTLENTAIGIAASAAGHVAQEFLWGHVTSHRPRP